MQLLRHLKLRGAKTCMDQVGMLRSLSGMIFPDGGQNAFSDSEVLMTTTFGPQEFLQRWADALRQYGIKVQTYPHEIRDFSRVEFAVCYDPPPGLLHKCPNLKAIQSMGAGVSPGMLEAGICPPHVPMLRIVDPLTAQRMATFVLWSVINLQRKCDAYLAAQQRREWDTSIEDAKSIDNAEHNVGLMGLGNIGTAVADLLLSAGYRVSAWTRTPKEKEGVRCFAGLGQLQQFAAQANVVVCLVPLTPKTRGILNANFFSWLPRGAFIINVSRGAHVVDEDLLAALDSGQLGGAVLDVYHKEPLPADSPLWMHPKVRAFPHVASTPHIPAVVQQVVDNRQSVLEGRPVPLERVVCRQRGY